MSVHPLSETYPCPLCDGTGLLHGRFDDVCEHCAGEGLDPDADDTEVAAAFETLRRCDGLFVGLLDEAEMVALDLLSSAGLARRSYEGSAGFFGLAKVRLHTSSEQESPQ